MFFMTCNGSDLFPCDDVQIIDVAFCYHIDDVFHSCRTCIPLIKQLLFVDPYSTFIFLICPNETNLPLVEEKILF